MVNMHSERLRAKGKQILKSTSNQNFLILEIILVWILFCCVLWLQTIPTLFVKKFSCLGQHDLTKEQAVCVVALIKKMLKSDQIQRCDIQEILHDPFFWSSEKIIQFYEVLLKTILWLFWQSTKSRNYLKYKNISLKKGKMAEKSDQL